jgi:hypothetical protein
MKPRLLSSEPLKEDSVVIERNGNLRISRPDASNLSVDWYGTVTGRKRSLTGWWTTGYFGTLQGARDRIVEMKLTRLGE